MAKRKITWSPRAKEDWLEILDFYYQRNGSGTYSEKLNTNIQKSIQLLSEFSKLGIKTDIENARNLISGNYCVFYEVKRFEVENLTIWDSRQDPDDLKI